MAAPLVDQPQLAPARDAVPPSAAACRREDVVQLSEGDALEWILRVDVHGQGVDGHGDSFGLAAVHRLERVKFVHVHRARHARESGSPAEQRGRSRGRCAGLDLHEDSGPDLRVGSAHLAEKARHVAGADDHQLGRARATGGLAGRAGTARDCPRAEGGGGDGCERPRGSRSARERL